MQNKRRGETKNEEKIIVSVTRNGYGHSNAYRVRIFIIHNSDYTGSSYNRRNYHSGSSRTYYD